jgi:CysZ protein
MLRPIRRFIAGLLLPLKGSVFLFQQRSLLRLAVAPLLLNVVLYGATLGLFLHYSSDLFALLLDRPDAWYWLVGYYLLRLLAFVLIGAAFLFSFTLVGTVLAAPFLELLSERTEAVLRAARAEQPFRFTRWATDIVRSLGHAFTLLLILALAFPLSFLPVVGPVAWLGLGCLLLAYDFTTIAMDRRRWSLREKWRRLLGDPAGALGFGVALFCLLAVPVVGWLMLPTAAVAGTLLLLDLEDQDRPRTSR